MQNWDEVFGACDEAAMDKAFKNAKELSYPDGAYVVQHVESSADLVEDESTGTKQPLCSLVLEIKTCSDPRVVGKKLRKTFNLGRVFENEAGEEVCLDALELKKIYKRMFGKDAPDSTRETWKAVGGNPGAFWSVTLKTKESKNGRSYQNIYLNKILKNVSA